jgi:hypothetical protein
LISAQGTGAAILPRIAEHLAERLELDRVSERRTRAVGLHVGDVARGQAGIAKGVAQHGLLGDHVGRRQSGAAPVVVRGRPAQHAQDPVSIPERLRQPLEHHHATALAADEAIRARIERLAASVSRHHPRPGQVDVVLGVEHQVDAAGERQAALTAPEALGRQVDGQQRRGTGRVQGDARPLEPEQVRDPAAGHAAEVARARVEIRAREILGHHQLAVVHVAHAHVDAGAGALEAGGDLPRVLQGLPRHLQQQALLRIHALRLARRELEERRIELIHAVEEPAPPRVHLPRHVRIRIVPGVEVPPLGWHLADAVRAVAKHPPERLGVRGPREAAAHANDRHALRLGADHLRQRRTLFCAQLGDEAGQRGKDLTAHASCPHHRESRRSSVP